VGADCSVWTSKQAGRRT